MHSHQFCGDWTLEKLERLRKYLNAYMKIFSKNMGATYYTTFYLDAFAGTGYINSKKQDQLSLFSQDKNELNDVESFQKGSAYVALETEPSFDRYIFVDMDKEHVSELEKLKSFFPDKSKKIEIINEDANIFLSNWCKNQNWSKIRAVVFLDPYGMEVDWKTIEIMGQTKGIDLWILLPIGSAIIRLLTRKDLPSTKWAERLTKFFGDDGWKDTFYKLKPQKDLFGNNLGIHRDVTFDSLKEYLLKKFKSCFEGVAENPLPLYNSKNIPIFYLFFACANQKGAKTAIKIAQYILGA